MPPLAPRRRPRGEAAFGDFPPASFDEIRLGTEFADVVPEPGTFACIATVGSFLLASRRSRA